jgi:hypothetical protein
MGGRACHDRKPRAAPANKQLQSRQRYTPVRRNAGTKQERDQLQVVSTCSRLLEVIKSMGMRQSREVRRRGKATSVEEQSLTTV